MPETTIEQQLQQTIEGLQAQNAELKAHLAERTAEVKSALVDKETAQKHLAEANETAKALEQVNEDLTAKIEELTKAAPAEAATEKKLEIPAGAFKVGKKSFRFITPAFHFEGNRIISEEAMQDKALLESLVEKGCGVIQEL